MKSEKLEEEIKAIVGRIEAGDLKPFVLSTIRDNGVKYPCDKYSFLNKLILSVEKTDDARGFKAWAKVGRSIKRGANAIYIFAPVFVKVLKEIKDDDGNTEIEEYQKLIGFKPIPVFRYEDTYGKEIPRKKPIDEVKIPADFNGLIKELNLTVKTDVFNGDNYGYFAPYANLIVLKSPEIRVFLHELSHAVDTKVFGSKNMGDNIPEREFVAELSSAILCNALGYETDLGTVKDYLRSWGYGKELLKEVKLIERVVRIVDYIINKTQPNEQQ